MAASMDFTSLTFFTISQPFLGAQLQFYPALQSAEFEYLLDCYVNGSASKKDKLSQVTLDFFKVRIVTLYLLKDLAPRFKCNPGYRFGTYPTGTQLFEGNKRQLTS